MISSKLSQSLVMTTVLLIVVLVTQSVSEGGRVGTWPFNGNNGPKT